MFFLHLLLFYLLGASVARFAPPALSDEDARRLHEEALRVMYGHDITDKWYRVPTPEWISGEIDGLNDVIETNPARQIILHELLDSPGETKFVRVINSAELLQRFEGTWRPMPDPSNYDRRLEELIVTVRLVHGVPRWDIHVVRHRRSEPEILSRPQTPTFQHGPQSRPQTPVSQSRPETPVSQSRPETPISQSRPETPVSQITESDIQVVDSDDRTNESVQRLAGYWYRVKGLNTNDVVHFRPHEVPIFYKLGARPEDWEVIQVADYEMRLIGRWFRMPMASTKPQRRRDEVEFLMKDGGGIYCFTPTSDHPVNI